MIYLLGNIVFGSCFGLTLKWVENRKSEDSKTVGMINYIVAMLAIVPQLFYLDAKDWTSTAMLAGGANGFSYFVAFFYCVWAIRYIGVANATVVGSLSMLAPILVGVLIWNENPNFFQMVGIALAIFALTMIGRKGDRINRGKVVEKPWFTPWIGIAFFSLCAMSRLAQEAFKHMSEDSVAELPVYLFSTFAVASVPSLAVLIWRGKRISVMEAVLGFVLGMANVVQIHFMLMALTVFDGFIVFPLVSAGGLMLTTVVATFLMGEKLGRLSYIGIAVACLAMVLLKGFASYGRLTMDIFANVIGVAGTMLILLAYFLLQTKKIDSEQLPYSLLNLFGAAGVVFSLMYDWNLPSFIVESFWVVISVIGVVRYWRGAHATVGNTD